MTDRTIRNEHPRYSSAPAPADMRASDGAEPSHAVEVLEHQLRRLAFGLHDGPVQTLSAAGAMLQRTARSDQLDAIRAEIAAAEGLLDYAVSEMREIMQELRPVELDEATLATKLAECARRFEAHSGVRAHLATTGAEIPLDYDIQVCLYRVVQEALSNVRKHANARSVEIGCTFAEDTVECSVADDGEGFDPDRARVLEQASHWGIAGMRERMLLIGGEVDVVSQPGEGTRVVARVPVEPK